MSLQVISASDVEQMIRGVVVFWSASDEEIRMILRLGLQRAVEEGGHFFFQDEPASHLYTLLSGRAKLCQITADGQQVNMRTIYPGQLFGAIGVVETGTNYPACAEALENSVAFAVSSSALQRFLEQRPHLAFGFLKLMTSYIQEMQQRYREMATEKVEQRIARVLLRLAGQAGKSGQGGIVIELSFSRQDLAEMAGTTLYTVSRTLSNWENRA